RPAGACSLGIAGVAEIVAQPRGTGTPPSGGVHRQRYRGRPNPLAVNRYSRTDRRSSADGTGGRADGGAAEHRAYTANPGALGHPPARAAAAGPRSTGAGTAPRLGAGFGARQAVRGRAV